jgi:hypothetical protein
MDLTPLRAAEGRADGAPPADAVHIGGVAADASANSADRRARRTSSTWASGRGSSRGRRSVRPVRRSSSPAICRPGRRSRAVAAAPRSGGGSPIAHVAILAQGSASLSSSAPAGLRSRPRRCGCDVAASVVVAVVDGRRMDRPGRPNLRSSGEANHRAGNAPRAPDVLQGGARGVPVMAQSPSPVRQDGGRHPVALAEPRLP